MININNLSISKKLGVLAGGALTGILVLTVIFTHDLGRIFQVANFANDTTVPEFMTLSKLETNFALERMLIWQHFAVTDPAIMEKVEGKIALRVQAVREALQEYEPTIASEEDRRLWLADRAAIDGYDVYRERWLAWSRSGKKAEAIADTYALQETLLKITATIDRHRTYAESLAFKARASAAETKIAATRTGILIGIATFAVVAFLAFLISRAIRRPIGEAVHVLSEIEKGHFETPIAVHSTDEMGRMLGALDRMQHSLKGRIEADAAAAMENRRIRTALDRVAVGSMLADTDGKIIYANDFSKNIFRTQVAEIRKSLPKFDPESIIGSSFDLFHANPAHQRNMLAHLTATHTAEIKLGKAVLRVIANPVIDERGERLGTVVQWVDRTQEVAVEEDVKSVVGKAIDGDLTARLGEEGKEGFFKALAQGMNQLIGNMADVVRTMSQAAAEVRVGADEISRGNLNLSQRTEEQASSLEETASSMEQMTSTVKNNADNAAQANQLAAAAREQAERGGKVVGSAVAAMSEINAASKKIADIIGVIDEIAFQTNLLALNAAVEAARAGEQGRGFAVVASEVRNLASRSAEAAKEIKALIQDSVGKVTEGAKLVDESGKVLGEIVTGVKKVTDVVAEIAASSREQASGIEQVNKAVTSMDAVTQQNAALVEEASAAAQALTEQAANLTQLISRYRFGEATVVAPSVEAPAAPERRANGRPWSGNAAPSKASAPKGARPARAAAAPRKTAVGQDNQEWQDF
jgi:methyl-accepting chemotaxis protein